MPLCKSATYQSSFFNCSIKFWNQICKLTQPSDFLNIKTFKNSITNLYKDELTNVFDPDKPCSWGLARNCGCQCQQQFNKHFLRFLLIQSGGAMHGTPGPFCTFPFGLFFFFATVTIYLERLRPIKLIKRNKNKTTVPMFHISMVYANNHNNTFIQLIFPVVQKRFAEGNV